MMGHICMPLPLLSRRTQGRTPEIDYLLPDVYFLVGACSLRS